MIEEAYVSFEAAKLLKEKGFDWRCFGYYVDDEPDDVKYSSLCEDNSIWEARCCSAPTFQMAMKWLREVHNIHFLFDPYLNEDYNVRYSIIVVFGTNVVNPIYKTDGDFTYEEACEAAIKYCLENLIHAS